MGNLTLAGLGERVGQELGLSDWVTIDQARIDAEEQDILCIEAGIQAFQVVERTYQQPRDHQSHQ